MMDIPNLPTDNLYKFMALAGLILFISALYLYESDFSKISDEIDQIHQEVAILSQDTITINTLTKDLDERAYIIYDYVIEKYTDLKKTSEPKKYSKLIKSFYSKGLPDSSSYFLYNVFYAYSLRKPELKPLYEEYKVINDKYHDLAINFNKIRVEQKSKLARISTKNKRMMWTGTFYSILLGIGFIISFYGFLFWYYKIQVHQDKLLRYSLLKEGGELEKMLEYIEKELKNKKATPH